MLTSLAATHDAVVGQLGEQAHVAGQPVAPLVEARRRTGSRAASSPSRQQPPARAPARGGGARPTAPRSARPRPKADSAGGPSLRVRWPPTTGTSYSSRAVAHALQHRAGHGLGADDRVDDGQGPGAHGGQVVDVGEHRGDAGAERVGLHERGQDRLAADDERAPSPSGSTAPSSPGPAEPVGRRRTPRRPGRSAPCRAAPGGARTALRRGRRVVRSIRDRTPRVRSLIVDALVYHRDEWPTPDFLDLPPRSAKPRRRGAHPRARQGPARGRAGARCWSLAAAYVDVWKLGWGTAYLDPGLGGQARRAAPTMTCWPASAARCWRSPGTRGGRRVPRRGPAELGFPCVEVSDGAVADAGAEKRRPDRGGRRVASPCWPRSAPRTRPSPVAAAAWAGGGAPATSRPGATWVVTEGRESGTVGLYDPDGTVREDVVDAVVGASAGSRSCSRRRARTSRRGSSAASAPTSTSATSRRPRCWGWRRCASACGPTRSDRPGPADRR